MPFSDRSCQSCFDSSEAARIPSAVCDLDWARVTLGGVGANGVGEGRDQCGRGSENQSMAPVVRFPKNGVKEDIGFVDTVFLLSL